MEYIHNRYDALVRVDDKTGKKTIHKYGLTFRTFNELIEYERSIDKKKSTNTIDKNAWLKSKGEY